MDEDKATRFARRMVECLNHGALSLMISVGHRTGLFDAMGRMDPSTCDAIARAATLDERYVREWLAAMVTGGIVMHDPDRGTYHLPPEHAASLTRASGHDNLAFQAQYIPLLAQVEEKIVESFRTGGGVSTADFRRFHDLMAEDSAAQHDAMLIDVILPLVPGMVSRLRQGITVLDAGCGRGHAVHLMARHFPESRFTGYDLSERAVEAAKREAERQGLWNAEFALRDLAAMEDADRFDLVTAFDAIHDQAHPVAVLARIAQSLKQDGTFLMADFAASSDLAGNLDHPLGPLMYTLSCMHCMAISRGQGGDGIGAMWGEETARRMLLDAGFRKVDVRRMDSDRFNNYYIASRAMTAQVEFLETPAQAPAETSTVGSAWSF